MKIYSFFTKTGKIEVPISEQNQSQAEAIAKNPVTDLMDKVRELTDLSNKLVKSQALELGNEVEKIEFTDIDGSKVTLRKGGPGSGCTGSNCGRPSTGGSHPDDFGVSTRGSEGDQRPVNERVTNAAQLKNKPETDSQRVERLRHIKNPNNPFYEKPEGEEKPTAEVTNKPAPLFDNESGDKLVDRLHNELKFPYVNAYKSTLGGVDRPSIMLTISKDPKEKWANGILQNSNYGNFIIEPDGTVEHFSGNLPKVRQKQVKDVNSLISHLNSKINQDPSKAEETDDLEKDLTIDNLRDIAGNLAKGGPGSGRHYEGGSKDITPTAQDEVTNPPFDNPDHTADNINGYKHSDGTYHDTPEKPKGENRFDGKHTITAKDHPKGSSRKVMFGSGVASGKTGTVVDRNEIKTDGRGIPTNIEGAYKPVDWKNETAIRYHEGQGSMSGKYDTMPHARLKPVEDDSESGLAD